MNKMNRETLNKILKPYWGQSWSPQLRINEGWCDLVYDLHNKILTLESNYSLCQIKDKFGGLRFYYDVPETIDHEILLEISNLVDIAEQKSYTICEKCGSISDVKMAALERWLTTICSSCLSKYSEEQINLNIDMYKPILLV